MRRSTSATRSLSRSPGVASIAPSAQGTTSSCLPTLASRTLAPTQPAIRRRWRRTSPHHRRQTQARADQHGLRGSSRRQPHTPAQQVHRHSGRQAEVQGRGEAARVQDLQVHHRGHHYRGQRQGTIHKVCANPLARCITPSKQTSRDDDAKWKAEQEKQRRNKPSPTRPASASSLPSAQPFRCGLMKRDLLFVIEKAW
jgi:hypothetical protein